MRKTLLLAVGLALAGGLSWVAAARAEPLNFAQCPRRRQVARPRQRRRHAGVRRRQQGMEEGPRTSQDAQAHLDKLREKIGFDICKDLHGLTAYGKEPGKHTGVLIVHANVNEKFLLEKAAKVRTTR